MNRLPFTRSLLVMLGLLGLFGFVFATGFRVDVAGGSPILEEEVVTAFERWADVTESDVEAQLSDDATTVFRYGDAAHFGPDTLSLTLSRTTEDDAPRHLEIWVNPSVTDERNQVLLHETGRVLGLAPTREGIMNPALQPDAPAELTPEDAEALQARQSSVPEDVNRDGVVDFYDLVQFAQEFGRTGVHLAGDINGDGVVDQQDLALLRAAYTFSAPSETAPESARDATPEEAAPEELPDAPEPDTPEDTPDEEATGEEGAEGETEEGLDEEAPAGEDTEGTEEPEGSDDVDDSPPDDEGDE